MEALFVDTLRRYFAGLPEGEVGWLAAARDPIVGKSLMLLHSRAAHPWTIAELATEVGSSRSTFVERFTRYLAEPPMAISCGGDCNSPRALLVQLPWRRRHR